MKIVFNQLFVLPKTDRYNAVGKARNDVSKTFESMGYKVVNIYNKIYHVPLLTGLMVYLSQLSLLLRIGKNNHIVIQYPTQNSSKVLLKMMRLYARFGIKFSIMIHDVQSLRYQRVVKEEIEIFNRSELLYVHTLRMAEALKRMGVTAKMKVMTLFDYYTNDPLPKEETMMKEKYTVVFAGNLKKSQFILALLNKKFDKIIFRFYGLPCGLNFDGKHFIYSGKFLPDNVSAIHGGWGLVWDGPSIDTCSGDMGQYLRYNASHKLSLYLAAGIPVIVWAESAFSEWVLKVGVGIAISTLLDLEEATKAIPNEEYKTMIENVHKISSALREGKFLKKVIDG